MNNKHQYIQQGLDDYEEQKERKRQLLEEKCWACPRTAIWVYGPGYENPAEGFRCDEHVPRKPCSCNMKSEFMWLSIEEGMNFKFDPEVHLETEDDGRHLPCIEWLLLEECVTK